MISYFTSVTDKKFYKFNRAICPHLVQASHRQTVQMRSHHRYLPNFHHLTLVLLHQMYPHLHQAITHLEIPQVYQVFHCRLPPVDLHLKIPQPAQVIHHHLFHRLALVHLPLLPRVCFLHTAPRLSLHLDLHNIHHLHLV